MLVHNKTLAAQVYAELKESYFQVIKLNILFLTLIITNQKLTNQVQTHTLKKIQLPTKKLK